jgi:ABC-type multidrug transport system permease subunit
MSEEKKESKRQKTEKSLQEFAGSPDFPCSKVFKIAVKELNLIKSQKAGLITAFALAIVVMGTLALAFSGTYAFKKVDVAIYAPEQISGFDREEFMKTLKSNDFIALHEYDSEKKVKQSIKDRQSKVGIVVKEPEATHGQLVIDLWYDNSTIASSNIFFELAKTQIQNIGFSMSQKILTGIWGKLSEIDIKLGDEVSRIDDFLKKLDESEAKLDQLEKDLNALNVSDARNALNSQQGKLLGFNSQLDSFSTELDSFINTVTGIDSKLGATKGKITAYNSEIAATKTELQQYYTELSNIESSLSKVAFPNKTQVMADIANAKTKIQSTNTKLDNASRELSAVSSEIDGLKSEISNPQTGVLAKLQADKARIASLKIEISTTRNDIGKMDAFVSNLEKTINEVRSLVANSKNEKTNVQAKLIESKRMINSFIDSLKDLSKVSPQFLADPLILNKIQAFQVEKLGVITPIALVILLMLTTILLTGVSFVDEINQGAYARMLLSTTPKPSLFAGKIIGQLAFALLQAAIIIALLVLLDLFFGIKATIAGGILDIALGIAVISFSFITYGLLITNFTKNQGTTILIALLLVIPMLFLSGAIIPIEMINPAIQDFATVLPLSASITILSELMIKGTSIAVLWIEMLILLIPSIAIIAFTLLNKRLR